MNATLRCAARYRLCSADAEDCALEFAEAMLLEKAGVLARCSRGKHFDAWLQRCAHNHVENFCRHRACVMRWEMPWPRIDEEGGGANREPASREAAHEAVSLRSDWMRRFRRAADSLTPEARDLLLRHYIDGEAAGELAASTGRSPDAVRMTIRRARKHVHDTLERQGFTEADADEYLAAFQSAGGGGRSNLCGKMRSGVTKTANFFEKCKNHPFGFVIGRCYIE